MRKQLQFELQRRVQRFLLFQLLGYCTMTAPILIALVGSRRHMAHGKKSDFDFQMFLPKAEDEMIGETHQSVDIYRCPAFYLTKTWACACPMQLRAFSPDVIGPLAPFVKAHYRELLNIAPAITYERTLELFEHDRPYPALAKRRMMWADILCSFLNTGDFSESIIVSPSCRKIIDYNRKTDLYDKEALDKKERYLRSDEVSSFFHSFGTNTRLQDALSDAVATACAGAAHIGQYEIMDYANSLTQEDNERRKITSELIKRTGGF